MCNTKIADFWHTVIYWADKTIILINYLISNVYFLKEI